MISNESTIQRACAWILFICGIGLAWLSVGESVTHIVLDCLGMDVHPSPQTGRMGNLVAVIGTIVGAYGGTKIGKDYINYKRERHCTLPHKDDTEKAG